MRFGERAAGDFRRLRPNRSLFWQALGSMLAFLIPLSAVFYFLTYPDGPWPVVLLMQAATLLVFLAATLSYWFTGFWVNSLGVGERGFFGAKHYVPVEDIGSLVLMHTYQGNSADTLPQLFICDASGKQVLRMRGQFWSEAKMRELAEILDLPLTEPGDVVTRSELLDSHPGLLYWFEKHPVLFAAAVTAGIATVGVILWVILLLTGSSFVGA